jgi:hypothetical protein
MTQLNFDATSVEPQAPMTALPKDRYNVNITDSEMKATAAGTGEYLQLELTVIDGQYANRKLWARLNLVNENKTAEDIARRELSAICHAVGVLRVTDSTELHGKPFAVDVVVEKRKDTGEDTNRIKGYIQTGSAPSAVPHTASKTAAPAKAAPPWAKKQAA